MQNPHGIDRVQTTETLIGQSFSTRGVIRLMRNQGPTETTRYGSLHTPTKKNLSEESYAGTDMSQGPKNQKPEYRFAQPWFTAGEDPKRARLRSEGGESTWKKATNNPEDPRHDCANTEGDTPGRMKMRSNGGDPMCR